MGYYTKFYFRAKLDFRLPEEIRLLLRNQFQSSEQARQMHERLLRSEYGASAAAQSLPHAVMWGVGDNYQAPYFLDQRWIGHPDHPFFSLDRTDDIPFSSNGDSFPAPVYVEHPDGSSRMEFTCEFNRAYNEIQQFLAWIAPYVRLKYGKRNRGRHKVWVGYAQPETFSGRVNFYVYLHQQQLPGASLVWEHSVEQQYNGQFW